MAIRIEDAGALLDNLRTLPHETDWVEFKVATFNQETVGKYISALANSAMFHDRDHAYMVFGIEDGTHGVVGTDVRLDKQMVGNDRYFFWLANLLDPKIQVQHLRVKYQGKPVEILCIDPGFQRPVTFKNTPYIRIDAAQQPLQKYPEIQKVIWQIATRYSFEAATLETNATEESILEDFDYETLLKLMRKKWESANDAIRILGSYELIEKNLQGKYHVRALLPMLAAKNINKFPLLALKSARIITYKGTDKLSAPTDREGQRGFAVGFGGIMRYIMERIPFDEVMLHGIRTTVFKIPEQTIREFVANAIIHQDFSISGARTTIEIYSDKIRIINPGKPLVPTDRFINTPSKSRNPRFARLMREGGLCEERARGVDLAISEIEKAHLPPPLIEASEDSTTVTVFMKKPFGSLSAEDRVRACFQHACLRHEQGDSISNSSLRNRFGLPNTQISQVSNVLNDAVEAGMIRPLHDDQAKKNARYVPRWD